MGITSYKIFIDCVYKNLFKYWRIAILIMYAIQVRFIVLIKYGSLIIKTTVLMFRILNFLKQFYKYNCKIYYSCLKFLIIFSSLNILYNFKYIILQLFNY